MREITAIESAPPGLAEHFWSKVERRGRDECWPWNAAQQGEGYGYFGIRRELFLAHRVSYALVVGRFPDGLELDHLCRNRICVNPAHLEPVSRRTNLLRGETLTRQNAEKAACEHGHAFSEANTYIRPDGFRGCRACKREAQRSYLSRLKERELCLQ